jgi:hypothetical protein
MWPWQKKAVVKERRSSQTGESVWETSVVPYRLAVCR